MKPIEENNDFEAQLKYVVPFDCTLDIDVPNIVEHKEQEIQELSDLWKDIDSNGLRKNCFVSPQKRHKFRDFGEIVYAIFKLRFLEPISHLRVDYKSLKRGIKNTLFGKILITDDKSHELMQHLIDWNYLKTEPIAISAEFNVRDHLPEELTENYHLIYLLSITAMSDQEFETLTKRLSDKHSVSQSVFEFFVLSDADHKRVKRLEDLIRSTPSIACVQQLGAFLPIDRNLVILHNTLDMNWIANKDPNELDIDSAERMSKLLANFFEQIGEFPTLLRYFKGFTDINKSIAERCLKMMTEAAKERRTANESPHESHFELLVVDRSLDVITPLTHCLQLRAFVYNELQIQYNNDMNEEYRILADIPVDRTSQLRQVLTQVSQSQAKEGSDKVLANKLNQNITNARNVCNKMKNKAFLDLLNIERSVLQTKFGLKNASKDKNSKTLTKSIARLVSESDKEVSNCDLKRLLIISRLFANDMKSNEELKKSIESKQKERHLDLTVVEDFFELTKKFVSNETHSSDEPIISAVVKHYLSDTLPYDRFPVLHRTKSWRKTSGLKRQLIVFVLGGISYNDLTAISQFDNNVIFCSNALITPNMLINSVVYQ